MKPRPGLVLRVATFIATTVLGIVMYREASKSAKKIVEDYYKTEKKD